MWTIPALQKLATEWVEADKQIRLQRLKMDTFGMHYKSMNEGEKQKLRDFILKENSNGVGD